MIGQAEPPASPLPERTFVARLVIGSALINLFVVALAAMSLYQIWHQDQQRAAVDSLNLARVLEEEVAGDIEKIDLALLTVADEVQRQAARGAIDGAVLNALLTRQQARLPEVERLSVTDAFGEAKFGSGKAADLPFSVAKRDFFLALSKAPAAGLAIASPLLPPGGGAGSIPLARRLAYRDGAFAGVVFAGLAASHLIETFSALEIGRQGVIALYDGPGNILAHYPEHAAGLPLPSAVSLSQPGGNAGTYTVRLAAGGIDRTLSFRRISGYPLYIGVGLDSEDYLAGWRDMALKISVLVLGFLFVELLASWLIYRVWKRQRLAIDTFQEHEAQLTLSAKVFESSGECIVVTDAEERILSVNKAFSETTGYRPDEVIGRTPRVMNSGHQSKGFYSNMWHVLESMGHWQGEIWDRRKDGSIFQNWLSISAVRDSDGRTTHYIGIFSDISERKAVEARVQFLAFHDPLTELPNRLLAMDHWGLAMAYADRARARAVLAFLDLDHFKAVNDTLGHTGGDDFLKAVALRLRGCVRDIDTVSRLGGDEFLIMFIDVRDIDVVSAILENLLDRMAAPFTVDGKELFTTVSMGVAVYPNDGEDFETLLKKADTAMYHAKEAGRNAYRFYTEQMNVDAIEHLNIRNGLRRALEQGEFRLYYQPQIDLAGGAVTGCEALIRWEHPELGILSPGRFIPVAEDSGLIVPTGEWVLREACRQAAAWRRAGLPDLVVAVNLSALQLKRGDIENSVSLALADSGLAPGFLELELTESILLHDVDKVLVTVQRLKALGVKLSIDDFGTGYSSLSYLKRFAVDKLKIDQSFIRDMVNDPNDAAIVRAIIQMAHSLNLGVIAEGVEDQRTLAALRVQHCDEAQGYHFAPPMPADEFARYLRQAVNGS